MAAKRITPDTAAQLIPVRAQGWTAGLANLFRYEFSVWKTPRALIQVVFWIVLINGMILAALASPDMLKESDGPVLQQVAGLYAVVVGFICPIAIMVTTQSAIIGEKQSGTAAWILSKPVARTAFVLAKFLASAVGFLVTMALLPGGAAYVVMSQFGLNVQAGGMLAGMGLVGLNLLFFQSFALMMGTFANSRRAVIGSSLILVFALQQLSQTGAGPFLPGHLPLDAITLISGQAYTNLVSLAETAGLTVLFVGLAFWRFGREEF